MRQILEVGGMLFFMATLVLIAATAAGLGMDWATWHCTGGG